jgi:RimJ/RimL family protein N-acetyltransferase
VSKTQRENLEKNLEFREVKKESEIEDLSNFEIQVFTDSQDLQWNLVNIKKEIKDGWRLYSVKFGADTIAALFLKNDRDSLYTKNTPIKLAFQGNGFSHRIKDFYEREAERLRLKRVVNYCPVDNFRMIALNESHGYRKTGNHLGSHGSIVEWEKIVS